MIVTSIYVSTAESAQDAEIISRGLYAYTLDANMCIGMHHGCTALTAQSSCF